MDLYRSSKNGSGHLIQPRVVDQHGVEGVQRGRRTDGGGLLIECRELTQILIARIRLRPSLSATTEN
jgi:hypothetical protein